MAEGEELILRIYGNRIVDQMSGRVRIEQEKNRTGRQGRGEVGKINKRLSRPSVARKQGAQGSGSSGSGSKKINGDEEGKGKV